ncbi:MAG TPA: FtsX-like permease family protein [Chloroflexia bacterium]|nr:FtsX-like permease family protein [Chloroflexia bacterium]
MNLWITLPARYLLGRKLRTVLTTFAVMFGVAVVFGVNAVLPTILGALQSSLLGASGQVDLTVGSTTGEMFPIAALEQARSVPGVAAVAPALRRQVTLLGGAGVSAEVVGLDPANAELVRRYQVPEGRFLNAADTRAALVSQTLAALRGLKPGDKISLPTPSGLTDLPIVGVVALEGKTEVIVPLALAQDLFLAPGQVNTIDVALNAAGNRETVAADLQARLGPAFKVGSQTQATDAFASVQLSLVLINFFGILTLFMGGFLIYNTFRTVVIERRHDIGMLRAVGATRRSIIALIVTESLLQGVVGSLLGLLLGYVFASIMMAAMNGLLETYLKVRLDRLIIPLNAYALALTLGIGTTLIAGLLPAIGASRVPVLAALRAQEEPATRGRLSWGQWIGVGLLALGMLSFLTGNTNVAALGGLLILSALVLLAPLLVNPLARAAEPLLSRIFPSEGGIAAGNMRRHPRRAAVTASALMIALAIIVALSGLLSSIGSAFLGILDRSAAADVILLPPALGLWSSNAGAGADFERELAAVPGIGTWAGVRYAAGQVDGVSLQVLGIDPVAYPKVSALGFDSGGPESYAALNDHGAIAGPIWANAHGVRAGDTVQLQTPGGPRPYRIAAIGADYLALKVNTIYISQANLAADFHRTEDFMLLANLAPDASRDQVKTSLEALLQRYPQFTLNWSADWRADQRRVFDQAFAGLYVVLILLTLPSLLGLINTLAINVLERTREIGVLRAVGATRGQVRRMVLAEALLLSAAGAALGLVGGLALGWALTGVTADAFTRQLTYSFPLTGVVLALALALLVGVIASLIPARQAARLRIVQALQYE